jgi:hypothetical protein
LAGRKTGPGTIFVPAGSQTRKLLQTAALELGVDSQGVAARPAGDAWRLKPVRIALWDQYGGSMPSGWTRWILEQFEFPFEVVYPAALDEGNLASRFDVLVLPDGAIPRAEIAGGRGRGAALGQPKPDSIPAEFRSRLGRITVDKTIPQLKKFAESGGAIVTIGSSTGLAQFFGLPLKNALVERTSAGQQRPLPPEKFYVPGSVLQASIDNTNPVAYGMGNTADVFFENSPAFRLDPDAAAKGVQPVAWFPNATPLRSGWAWGQGYLEGAVGAAAVPVGEGKLFVLGIEAAFRGQPHGTYKLLFNSIYFGGAKASPLAP